MLTIIFDSIIKIENNISFTIKTYEDDFLLKKEDCYFKLNNDFDVDDNLIAIALSTFCGNNIYDEIYFNLKLCRNIINKISEFTNASIKSKYISNEEYIDNPKKKIALNFRGGIDSLAAKLLLKNHIELISLDFSDLNNDTFRKFNPYTVETNFRQLGYSTNSWTSLGVGSILYRDFLDLRYHLFGTPFESFHMHAKFEYASKKEFIEPPFNYAGINDLKIIQGLSEVGTTLVVCKMEPNLINDAIKLSPKLSEKRYRKQLIIEILKEKYGLKNIEFEHTTPPIEENRLNWGTSYINDFIILYLLKNIGINETSKLMRNIPAEAIDFVNMHQLNFYEKYNPNFFNCMPNDIKKSMEENLLKSNIEIYTEYDFKELNEVIAFLSKFYTFLNEVL